MVYLNVESDMDTIMDCIIDSVAGSSSRNKVVNGNVCMHVDDLIFTGTDDLLSSFARELKKSFQIGSHVLAQIMSARSESLDLSQENVVCNLDFSVALDSCCRFVSRSGVLRREVHLPSPMACALDSSDLSRDMPGPPARSTLANQTLRRQQVGNPKLLGAHPNSHFLKAMPKYQRVDMFNTMFNMYLSGRFFKQDAVSKEYWMEVEDIRPLTKLLTEDRQNFLDVPRCSQPCCATPMMIRSACCGGTVFREMSYSSTSCNQRSCRRTA